MYETFIDRHRFQRSVYLTAVMVELADLLHAPGKIDNHCTSFDSIVRTFSLALALLNGLARFVPIVSFVSPFQQR